MVKWSSLRCTQALFLATFTNSSHVEDTYLKPGLWKLTAKSSSPWESSQRQKQWDWFWGNNVIPANLAGTPATCGNFCEALGGMGRGSDESICPALPNFQFTGPSQQAPRTQHKAEKTSELEIEQSGSWFKVYVEHPSELLNVAEEESEIPWFKTKAKKHTITSE